MKDEIKEIKVNKANKSITFINNGIAFSQFGVADEILDLITNLQEENRILKETNVYCNRTDCSGRIKDSRKYDSVYQEKEDYKSRNEKAIKLLKEAGCYDEKTNTFCDDVWEELSKLLNILQGEDKENLYKYTPEEGFRLVGDDNE